MGRVRVTLCGGINGRRDEARIGVYNEYTSMGELKGISKPRLDLDLISELIQQAVVLDDTLHEHLECNHTLRSLLPREIDRAKLTPPQRLACGDKGTCVESRF